MAKLKAVVPNSMPKQGLSASAAAKIRAKAMRMMKLPKADKDSAAGAAS